MSIVGSYMLEYGLETLNISVDLTSEEIKMLRNILSDVQKDKIGISLNLKIANAILDSLK